MARSTGLVLGSVVRLVGEWRAIVQAGQDPRRKRAAEGGVPVAGQTLVDLAGFSGVIGAWHLGNGDGGAGVGLHTAGGSADGPCSANDQRDIAL